LLCFPCNGGIGQFQEDSHLLRRAAGYVDLSDPEAAVQIARAKERAYALKV